MNLLSLTEKHEEALTVAMVLAPGVYVRNRMYDFFTDAGVQRAKTRAATLRGILPHLAKATTLAVRSEERGSHVVYVLKYEVAPMRLSRVVELTPSELATLRVAAEKKGIVALPASDDDRTSIEAALASLLELGPDIAKDAVR